MQQTSIKGIQEQVQLGGEGDPLGTVQETEISPYWQNGIWTNQNLVLENETI